MEIYELKQKILDNQIPSFLIFTGEETELINIYIKQIESKLNKTHKVLNSLKQYLNLKLQKNIFNQAIDFVIIKDDDEFIKNKKLWTLTKNITDHVILVFSAIPTDLNKEFLNVIVKFNKMDLETIRNSLLLKLKNNNIELPSKYLDWLIENCSNDYNRCLNEIDKILIFKDDTRNKQELFKQFVKEDIFHTDVPDCIFDFSNAFIERRIKDVYKIYEDLKQTSDGPIMILSVLYNNIRNILLIQSAANPSAESLNMKEGQFKALRYKVGKYSTEELVNMLLLISQYDKSIKMGEIEDRLALEAFLTNVL